METANVLQQAIATMPRGGSRASWLDRRFQTNALEYLDRDDVPDAVKQKVIGMLDRLGTLSNQHEEHARTALKVVADIKNPRILELGAGHGKLSAKILELHPTATVTVSDVNPDSVDNIAAGELGSHPRADVKVVDATAIDAPDASYDLVVFALAFHHLPPPIACRAIAEATRVGGRFLVIDLKRQSPVRTLLFPALALPVNLTLMPWSWIWPGLHDGFISVLRAYSLSALEELGLAADPGMRLQTLPSPRRFGPPSHNVVFSRSADHD
ncbi:class I SAM-dependent methyltransferase [Mycobacterium ahvazicum]|nr:class I SAM-dependent methyltransferase [Mycobacterium ahvazicum]